MTFKIKFLSVMTKVTPNNGKETKSDIFPSDIFEFHIILKRYNDFYNWNLSISLQK